MGTSRGASIYSYLYSIQYAACRTLYVPVFSGDVSQDSVRADMTTQWGRQPKTATSVAVQAEGEKWQTARILIRHNYHGSVQCIQQPCVLRRYVTRLCRRDMTTEGWAGTSNCFFSWVQFWTRGRGYTSPTAGDRNKDIVLSGADVDVDTAAVVHWTQN